MPRKFVIQGFVGEQSLSALPAVPAAFDNDKSGTENMLVKRGKRFVKLAGVSHKKYTGLSAREPSVLDYQQEVSLSPVKLVDVRFMDSFLSRLAATW